MNNVSGLTEDPGENRALGRFAAVQLVVQAIQSGQSMVQAIEAAALQAWDGRFFSARTIEDWYYRYKRDKFQALQNRPRSDRGTPKAMDPAAVEALIKLRRANPQFSVKSLSDELERQGILEPGTISASTLQRRLAEVGLDRQSLRSGSGLMGGPTKAFEVPLPNLLWMADCMHGPTIKTGSETKERTYLFALLDDCTRLVVHAQFYGAERLDGFLDTLRRGVQTRGLPDKLYTDNGSAFRSQHLAIVCANLGIRLIHAKPYHAWSKGKIERFFSTLQVQFLPTLVFEPVGSIEALNGRLWKWLETDYHQRVHGVLSGESPAGRFARLGTSLRLLEKDVPLERLFFMRQNRRVRKDATFSLGSDLWEVATHLRGQVVTVRFDPITLERMEVWLGERFMGLAIRCNKHRNSKVRIITNDYDREIY
jgi:transposase InsO family protein